MSDTKEVKFPLKVMINKEKTKVLFAEADSDFTDILLSFLTLPLGRIIKVLEKRCGDKTPTIGSLNTLFDSLANLDASHFCTESAKMALLDPKSSFEADHRRLKLDVSDSPPPRYFSCTKCPYEFCSVSMYYDQVSYCKSCRNYILVSEKDTKKGSETAAEAGDDGTFTKRTTTFVITDDLQILPNAIGLLQTVDVLGIEELDSAKLTNISFGLSEIMNLLKASLLSQTPLSDVILNRERPMSSTPPKSEQETTTTSHLLGKEKTPKPKKIVLKIMVQKSTSKFLYAQAEEDFVELLFSFLVIPTGGVGCLLDGETSIGSIDNLYRSVADLIDDKYFKAKDVKTRLIKPKLPHGYISKNHVLPLDEECLPDSYYYIKYFSSTKFPKGQGVYLNGPITYHVTDDLIVTPLCIGSIVSCLSEMKIGLSDVEEVEVEIGLLEEHIVSFSYIYFCLNQWFAESDINGT